MKSIEGYTSEQSNHFLVSEQTYNKIKHHSLRNLEHEKLGVEICVSKGM